MSDLAVTELWFKRAVANPTQRNLDVQVGCHLEEVDEMLEVVQATSVAGAVVLTGLQSILKEFSEGLKKGDFSIAIRDRKEFLDACVDQVVTATGSGYMAGMQVAEGLTRVNNSNFSKFDDQGMPIFDENGKIKKGPNYKKPDLEGLY